MNDQELTQPNAWWKSGRRPIWLVAVVLVVCHLAARWGMGWFDDASINTAVLGFALIFGFVIGQCCFLAVVSGLGWRTWSSGFVFGIAVATVEYIAALAGFASFGDFELEALLALAVFPAVLLSLVSPLYGFRFLRGWRLTAVGEVASRKERLRIEDLFSLTAVVAASLVVLQIPPSVVEGTASQYWVAAVVVCAVAFGVGSIVLPICCWLVFGTARKMRSWIGLSLLGLAIPVVILGGYQLFVPRTASLITRLEPLMPFLAFSVGAIGAAFGSLFFLAWCGISLTRTHQPPTADEPSLAADGASYSTRSTRWLTAVAIAVAIICSIGMATHGGWRAKAQKEIARLTDLAKSRGGMVQSWDYKVRTINLGKDGDDDDFHEFRDCKAVTKIDLSDSRITDRGLAMVVYFPQASFLSLKGTRITDEGLAALRSRNRLRELDLSDTKVTFEGVIASGMPRVATLKVGFGQFTREEVQRLRAMVARVVVVGPAPAGTQQ